MIEQDLTRGSITGNIMKFALPYLLAYFLQLLYGLADLYIIGQYEDVDSLSAVSIGSQVMHALTVLIVSLAVGSTVEIARSVGAKDRKAISMNIGNTMTLFAALSAVMALVLLAVIPEINYLMSTPSEAIKGCSSYLRICFLGIPFIFAYNVVAAIYRGLGDSKTPMYLVAIACVLNIALDYLLIGAMHLGPSGAALGTTLAQGFSVLVSVLLMRRQGLLDSLSLSDLRPQERALRGILKTGAPVAVQDGFIQIAFLVITIIANQRGVSDSAAVGIVEKVITMLFLVPSAMLSTISTISAQNIGAGLYERSRKVFSRCLGLAMAYGILIAVLLQFASGITVALFTDDQQVIILGGQYLRSYGVDTFFAGIHFCYSGFFIASGYSMVSFIHNLISVLTTRLPLSYLLSINYPDTLYPMGLAAPAGSLLSIVICMGFYVFLRRRKAIR